MSKETFHVISNTHWDREWYQCHEKYIVRLVELMDRLTEIMESKKDYRFISDGQFAMVGDYLDAKPEMRGRIEKLVSEGRLLVGPWYTQPLENIVGGEALVRNLQKGVRESEKLGGAMRFSYEIDEFGHTSQLPQILDGFDIHGVMAWRGVPTNCRSYFKWQGADGTVADFFNSNMGYGEATSLPYEEEDFTEIIDGTPFEREGLKNHVKRIRDLRFHVSDSSHMLWLNGIDHSWAQEDILEVCEKIEKLFPDYEVKQSTPEEYANAVKEDLKKNNIEAVTEKGELMFTNEPVLESTNSLHPRQKRRHYESEKNLVRMTEPLTVSSYILGRKYPEWAIERAWKYILENHAHDSLGCCSVDEVFEQVMARYGASLSLSEQINDDSFRYIMSCGEKEPSLWIFNMSEKPIKGSVKASFDVPEGFGGEYIYLETPEGEKVDMSIISADVQGDVRYNPRLGHPVWGNVAHFEAIINSPEIPAFGALRLKILEYTPGETTNNRQNFYFVKEQGVLENDYLKVEINPNGTFNLTDKRNGKVYPNQLILTDDGEAGNCYVHIEAQNDMRRFTSLGAEAQINTLYDLPNGSACEIIVKMNIPKGITPDRKRRTEETDVLTVRTVLSLEKDSEYLGMDITVDNKCKNHRLRALFPTYIDEAKVSESGQAFDEVERLISLPHEQLPFELPYLTHPMQDYCAVKGENCGLGIAARGIYEYECTDDNAHALAITLLRAIEVIDNKTFEKTPKYFMQEAQNICEVKFSLSLIPCNSNRENLLKNVKSALMPPVVLANRDTEDSLMPGYVRPKNILGDKFTALTLQGEGLEITSFKKSLEGNGLVVRVRNRADKKIEGNLKITLPGFNGGDIFKINLEEKREEKIGNGNEVSFGLLPKKLATFKFEIK